MSKAIRRNVTPQSTPTLPGMDDLGTRVQAFAVTRGMRNLHPREIEILNELTDAEVRIVLSYRHRLGLVAGIVEAYLTEQRGKACD